MSLHTKGPVRNLLHHQCKPFWNMKLDFWNCWPNTLTNWPHAWNKKYCSSWNERLDMHDIGVHVPFFPMRMVKVAWPHARHACMLVDRPTIYTSNESSWPTDSLLFYSLCHIFELFIRQKQKTDFKNRLSIWRNWEPRLD